MRKVLCLVLALIFCVAMACPAFAAVPSGGNEPGTGATCDHDYDKNGYCSLCKTQCKHEKLNSDGTCKECGNYISHTHKFGDDGKCTICGKKKVSDTGNPATGDMITVWASVMTVSMGALGTAAVCRKKDD